MVSWQRRSGVRCGVERSFEYYLAWNWSHIPPPRVVVTLLSEHIQIHICIISEQPQAHNTSAVDRNRGLYLRSKLKHNIAYIYTTTTEFWCCWTPPHIHTLLLLYTKQDDIIIMNVSITFIALVRYIERNMM